MYIGEIMHTNLITVSPETSLVDARDILEREKIDHLLVVDRHKKLLGILSDRDLKKNWASPATSLSTHELNYLLEKVTVGMIMVKTVVTVPVGTTIERAAYIMQQEDINCLPVMKNDQLAGIITSTDVMEVLLNAIGISEGSMRVSVFASDSVGQLARITEILGQENVNIQSLISWQLKQHPGVVQFIMRLPAKDGERAMAALARHGYKSKNYYAEDLTPFLP